MGQKLADFLTAMGAGLSGPQGLQLYQNQIMADKKAAADAGKLKLEQASNMASIMIEGLKTTSDPQARQELTAGLDKLSVEYPQLQVDRLLSGGSAPGQGEIGPPEDAGPITSPIQPKADKPLAEEKGFVTLLGPDGSKRKSFRKKDKRIDPLLDKGWTIAPTQTQQGDIPKSDKVKLDEQIEAYLEVSALTDDIIKNIETNPGALGTAGAVARYTDSFKEQALGLAQNIFDVPIEASMDIEDYNFEMIPASMRSAELKTNLYNLAIASAATKGQTGRALSDADVQREIASIGGDVGSRKQLVAKIKATQKSALRRVKNKYEILTNKPFPTKYMNFNKSSSAAPASPKQAQREAELDRQLEETRQILERLKANQ